MLNEFSYIRIWFNIESNFNINAKIFSRCRKYEVIRESRSKRGYILAPLSLYRLKHADIFLNIRFPFLLGVNLIRYFQGFKIRQ